MIEMEYVEFIQVVGMFVFYVYMFEQVSIVFWVEDDYYFVVWLFFCVLVLIVVVNCLGLLIYFCLLVLVLVVGVVNILGDEQFCELCFIYFCSVEYQCVVDVFVQLQVYVLFVWFDVMELR